MGVIMWAMIAAPEQQSSSVLVFFSLSAVSHKLLFSTSTDILHPEVKYKHIPVGFTINQSFLCNFLTINQKKGQGSSKEEEGNF